jgi:hypothetical protein
MGSSAPVTPSRDAESAVDDCATWEGAKAAADAKRVVIRVSFIVF